MLDHDVQPRRQSAALEPEHPRPRCRMTRASRSSGPGRPALQSPHVRVSPPARRPQPKRARRHCHRGLARRRVRSPRRQRPVSAHPTPARNGFTRLSATRRRRLPAPPRLTLQTPHQPAQPQTHQTEVVGPRARCRAPAAERHALASPLQASHRPSQCANRRRVLRPPPYCTSPRPRATTRSLRQYACLGARVHPRVPRSEHRAT
mmetsp:Transcript_12244/g.29192  ORF Transcript_12244/g.29192 Transcript_12244/m.29192 type:complete len:205 (+) Transcript_12244:206-820(+)